MRLEPPIDRARLIEAVRRAYHLDARDLAFLPVGLGSACYELRAARGKRHFLKLWTHLRIGQPDTARQHAALALSNALGRRVPDLRLPIPLPTRQNALWADLDGMPFALFPLLPGAHRPPPWPAPLYEALGGTIATIQRATPAIEDLRLPSESFDPPLEQTFRRDLEAAAHPPASVRPTLHRLRAWTLEHADDIEHQLARLHRLGAATRAIEGPLVLSHMDLHTNNLLVDHDGRLAILDWDDARLAPPEYDLAAPLTGNAAPDGIAPVIEGYRRAGGTVALDLDHVAFYLLRRSLDDTAVTLARLLAPDAEEREDAILLDSLQSGGPDCWSRLDATLEAVASALRADRERRGLTPSEVSTDC